MPLTYCPNRKTTRADQSSSHVVCAQEEKFHKRYKLWHNTGEMPDKYGLKNILDEVLSVTVKFTTNNPLSKFSGNPRCQKEGGPIGLGLN